MIWQSRRPIFVDNEMTNQKSYDEGKFYTPLVWCEYLQARIDSHFSQTSNDNDWRKKTCVVDSSCGSGNLTETRAFTHLFQSTKNSSEYKLSTRNSNAIFEEFDFLQSLSLPELITKELEKAPRNCKVLMFINNPPFKASTVFQTQSDSSVTPKTRAPGITKTFIGELMLEKGFLRNLQFQFLYKIDELAKVWLGKFPNIYNLIIVPTNVWCGAKSVPFLQHYYSNWRLEFAFAIPAKQFPGLKGNWSISFSLWKYERNNIRFDLPRPIDMLSIQENQQINVSQKSKFYCLDSTKSSINSWLKESSSKSLVDTLPLTSACVVSNSIKPRATKWSQGSIGYLVSGTNAVGNNDQQVRLLSSVNAMGHGIPIQNNENHLLRCCCVFFVRRFLKPTWYNWHLEMHSPEIDSIDLTAWAINCAVFSCFDDKSLQSSLRNVAYQNKNWDLKNNLFPYSRQNIKKLAMETNNSTIIEDLNNFNSESFLFECLENHKRFLYAESLELLEIGVKLIKIAFQQSEIIAWDSGWVQIKKACSSSQVKSISILNQKLADKLSQKLEICKFIDMALI